MVAKLMTGGSNHAEAEMVIAQRKKAFNKADKEYKKELVKTDPPNSKRPPKKCQIRLPNKRVRMSLCKIGTINLCLGLTNKTHLLKEIIINDSIDVLCMQETEVNYNLNNNLLFSWLLN